MELGNRNSELGTHRQQRLVAVAVGVAGPAPVGPERVGGRPYGHSLMAGSHRARRARVMPTHPRGSVTGTERSVGITRRIES